MSPFSGRAVAVTGPTGHVGANLVRALLAQGARVRCLVHSRRAALDGLDVEAVEGELANPESLARTFRDVEVVFHLAARISITGSHGGLVEAVNVAGAEAVARASHAAGARRMVHVSSVHAFDHGDPSQPLTETAPRPTPKHPAYDRSKAAGEAAVRRVAAETGLEVVVAHPTGVLGPNDFEPSRMGRTLLLLYYRRLPALLDGGFDWVDVRDVVGGLMSLADRGRPGESYLLSGAFQPIRGVAEVAARITGRAPPRMDTPRWLASATAPLVATVQGWLGQEPLYTPEALHAVFKGSRDVRSDKARVELGYTARPLEETLRDAYASFEAQGRLGGRAPGAAGGGGGRRGGRRGGEVK